MAENNEKFFDFDGIIENDGQLNEFKLLPAGDYKFTVEKCNKGFYEKRNPNSKLQDGTPKVEVEMIARDELGNANYVRTTLFLCSSFEWKLSQFFCCIGLKKRGEQLRMDWDGAIGREGMCRLSQRSYTNKEGEQKTINEVDSFIEPKSDAPAKPKMVPGQL